MTTREYTLKPICDECGSQIDVSTVLDLQLCAACKRTPRKAVERKVAFAKSAVIGGMTPAKTETEKIDLAVDVAHAMFEWLLGETNYGIALAAIEQMQFQFRQPERDRLTVAMLDKAYPAEDPIKRDAMFSVLRKMDHDDFMAQVKFWLGGER